MASIHDVFKDDCVSGVIVGGDFICAKLCYEGRQQGRMIYAESVERIREMALFIKKELLSDLGELLAKEVYPDSKAWKLIFLK